MHRFHLSDVAEAHPSVLFRQTGAKLYELRAAFQNAHYAIVYDLIASLNGVACELRELYPDPVPLPEDAQIETDPREWSMPMVIRHFCRLVKKENERVQIFGTELRALTKDHLEGFYLACSLDLLLLEELGHAKIVKPEDWSWDWFTENEEHFYSSVSRARKGIDGLSVALDAGGARSNSDLILPEWEPSPGAFSLLRSARQIESRIPRAENRFTFAPPFCSSINLTAFGQVENSVMDRMQPL